MNLYVAGGSDEAQQAAWDFAIAANQPEQLVWMLDNVGWLPNRAGVDYSGVTPDGRSLRPRFEEEGEGRSTLFLEYHPRTRMETYNHSILTRDRRLTLYPSEPDWGELFDLDADPGEHNNLFGDERYRADRDRLAIRLNQEFPAKPDAGEPLLAKW